jgi:hypothetical protein
MRAIGCFVRLKAFLPLGICTLGYRGLNDRAIFHAGAAACAQVLIDIARTFAHLDLEFAWFAFNRFKIRVRNQLNV